MNKCIGNKQNCSHHYVLLLLLLFYSIKGYKLLLQIGRMPICCGLMSGFSLHELSTNRNTTCLVLALCQNQ